MTLVTCVTLVDTASIIRAPFTPVTIQFYRVTSLTGVNDGAVVDCQLLRGGDKGLRVRTGLERQVNRGVL